MPTYQYHCRDCDNDFEEFQSITDEPLQECPRCHGSHVRRVISGGGGLIFKGSGFYITDYRGEKYKKDAARDNGVKAGKGDSSTSEKTSPPKGANSMKKQ
jgi:putative FmdB family regulatory protein